MYVLKDKVGYIWIKWEYSSIDLIMDVLLFFSDFIYVFIKKRIFIYIWIIINKYSIINVVKSLEKNVKRKNNSWCLCRFLVIFLNE